MAGDKWDLGFDMGDEELQSLLPEGSYVVRCDDIEMRESKAGKFFNLHWKLVILEGDYKNRQVWQVTTLKPAVPHIGFMRACAAFNPDLEMKGTKFDKTNFVGRKALAEIRHEEYQGIDRARVADLQPMGEGGNSGATQTKPETASAPTAEQEESAKDVTFEDGT
jgi:hypothetical protein